MHIRLLSIIAVIACLAACAPMVNIESFLQETPPKQRHVQVTGWISLAFEGTHICSTEAACEWQGNTHSDCLWLDVENRDMVDDVNERSCRYGSVIGWYSRSDTGHMGGSPKGGIDGVTYVHFLPQKDVPSK